jgi:hypothetical protein
MDDVLQFREIIVAHGGKAGNASRKLVAFLRSKGLTEEAIDFLGKYVLKKSAYVSAIEFHAEDGWLGANADDFVPIALRDGLLIIGSCPNGDPLAVDVREQLGAVGYIDHETMWQSINVREVFFVLARSPGQLVLGLDDDRMPLDYYEAKEWQRKSLRTRHST